MKAASPRFSFDIVASVFVGGAAGTAIRYILGLAFPLEGGLPITLTINVTGAFALGALSPLLTRRKGANWTRLNGLVTTGVLGGYTTYGMFAVDTDGLLDMNRFGESVVYGLATVAFGAAAAAAGRRLVARAPHAEATKQ